MIVTCQQCVTQFHLDDAKVPEGGIRVRCSRCKFAFLVESPNGSELERAESIARDAFSPEAGAIDESESDWKFSEDVENLASNDLAAAAVDDLLGPPGAEVEHRFDHVDPIVAGRQQRLRRERALQRRDRGRDPSRARGGR